VGEVVSLDGKSLRGSYARDQGIKALNLVTAWASQQQLILRQVKVEDKYNEITAIPTLLKLKESSDTLRTSNSQETTLKRSLRQKQKRAAMSNDYMLTVLNFGTVFGIQIIRTADPQKLLPMYILI